MARSLKGGLLMGSKRQTNQPGAGLCEVARGEAGRPLARGTEDPMAARGERLGGPAGVYRR